MEKENVTHEGQPLQEACGASVSDAPAAEESQTATLEQMNSFCKEYAEQKEVVDSYKRIIANETSKLEAMKKKGLKHLQVAELKSFKSEFGTFGRKDNFSVKVPKTEVERNALRKYFECEEVFDSLWTVNSQSLNAYYKEAFAKAVEEQNPDFSIPGIEEPKHYDTVTWKKA